MNFTKPNEKNYEDKPEDWLFTALVFADALGNILAIGQGVVVEITGELIAMHPEMTKVIVHNNGKQIGVVDVSKKIELKEGDIVQMINMGNMIN